MKKITVLMLHLNYGGLEKQITTLLNNLVNKYKIEIISVYDLLSGKSFYELDPKIKVRFLLPYGPNKKEIKEAIKSLNIINIFKHLMKVVKILYTKYIKVGAVVKKINTDILISSRIEFSRQIKRKDIVTISQEHSYIDTDMYKSKVKKSFKNIKYLVVMTKKAKNEYESWLKNEKNKPEVIIIPNMIEESKKVSNLTNKQIIAIGRLEEEKDFESLIDVFYKVNQNHTDWTLKLVGEGSKKEELSKKVKDLYLEKNVIFTGKLTKEEVNENLANSSIFLLTSKKESFSLVLAEAMSCGLACVSYDIDVGPREIIENGTDGILIPNRNKDMMSKEVMKLIENENRRNNFGSQARKNISRFYISNVVKYWIDLFER